MLTDTEHRTDVYFAIYLYLFFIFSVSISIIDWECNTFSVIVFAYSYWCKNHVQLKTLDHILYHISNRWNPKKLSWPFFHYLWSEPLRLYYWICRRLKENLTSQTTVEQTGELSPKIHSLTICFGSDGSVLSTVYSLLWRRSAV